MPGQLSSIIFFLFVFVSVQLSEFVCYWILKVLLRSVKSNAAYFLTILLKDGFMAEVVLIIQYVIHFITVKEMTHSRLM